MLAHAVSTGSVCGVVSWIASAAIRSGEVTVNSLGNSGLDKHVPFVVGNVVSLVVSAVVCVAVSWRTPQNYDWDTMQVT